MCSVLVLACLGPAIARATVTVATSNLAANQVTLGITSDTAGNAYFALLKGDSTTCGTATQIKAGEDSSSATAFRQGSLTLTASTAGSYTVRNLAGEADYTVCIADAASATTSVSFTTEGATDQNLGQWTTVGSAGFSAGEAHQTSLAFAPDGTPYVAYEDAGNSYKATVMKYDATLATPAWVVVGIAGFSAGETDIISLAFAPDGTPYVAYEDAGNSNKATVMKYDAALTTPAWVVVGIAGFSSSTAPNISLAFAPDGTPYAAYLDTGNSYTVTVMKYDTTLATPAWSVVASTGYKGTESYGIVPIAFAPNGTPYVVFQGSASPYSLKVIAYDTTLATPAWTLVGNTTLSSNNTGYPSLALAPDGTPFVAFEDGANSAYATVMKYDATLATPVWRAVGKAGFSKAMVTSSTLAFAPDGTPFIAYAANSSSAVVKRFDAANSWTSVGSAGISSGTAGDTSLAFAPDGTPYVAFRDDGNGYRATVMTFHAADSPSVFTLDTSGIGKTAATLNAAVDDDYADTTVSFQYGTTTSYGSTATPATSASITAGTGDTSVAVSLSGLTAGTTYHYRVKATNAVGTSYGDDESFTTLATTSITTSPTASSITYGQTLVSSTLSGGAGSVAGSFAWSSSTTVPALGASTQSVTFTPTSSSYAPVTGTVSVTAKGTSSLAVSSAVTSLKYGVSGKVAVTAKGITGKTGPAGSISYKLVSSSSKTVASGTAALTAATGSSTASVAIGSTLAPGYYVLTLGYTGSSTYNAATSISTVVVIGQATQTITFTQPTTPASYGAKVTLSATSTSGLAVSFSASGACGVSGTTLKYYSIGACTVTALQPGNTDYAAATSVSRSVTVAKAKQTITFTQPTTPVTYGAVAVTLSATASSGLAVSFSSSTAKVCTVSGTKLSYIAAGTCTVVAAQAGNSYYAVATAVSHNVTVNKATQTITFAAIAAQTHGAKLTLSATASSKLAVSFSSTTTTVCTVSGTTATLLKAGTCTLQAAQAGNANYSAATAVSRSFTVK